MAETLRNEPKVTEALAEFAATLTFDRIPVEARTVARHCLLDMVGVTLAGKSEPLSQMLHAQVEDEGGAPHATLIGWGEKTSTSQAALYNGSAAHALDYDDVLGIFTGHPTVAVMPAVLALAERHGKDGKAVITAFVAGVEVLARIGGMMSKGHYARGWHSTGTIGAIGAAAGCANLLGLDAEATNRAIGIAASQAAGLKSNFGTMTKPLHAGKAAQNGLLAATLAARGFTARENTLDIAQGFGDTMAEGVDIERALERIGELFHTQDTLFKYHPACYGTHAPTEAALRLRLQDGFDPALVEKIEINVPTNAIGMCDIAEPKSGLEAKFSLAHNVSLGLLNKADGSLSLYQDETFEVDGVADLRRKVVVHGREDYEKFFSEVVVTQKDGTVLRQEFDIGQPMTDLGEQEAKLEKKFRALATPLLGAEKVDGMVAAIAGLEDQAAMAGWLADSRFG
ncbi:MAG: MmgE/PrpD family protein [Alphaproteobacteria bacterium]|nr:MmgE/PrpD family protein [Alphaproteobacteria bacterium]MCB9931634.1 MmgE/PrpD family protein [Alphaproteobacteria bacterium]